MTTADSPSAAGQIPLADLRKGMRGLVTAVVDDDTAQIGDTAGSTVARRLREIGFVPGEPVEVIEEVWPGGDPMAVRIGATIFALRRREARAVLVQMQMDKP